MTAVVAPEATRQLLTSACPSGVFHSEEAIEFEPILSEVKRALLDLRVEL